MTFQFDAWQLASAGFAVVVWFLRLEGRVAATEKQDELQTKLIEANSIKLATHETKIYDRLLVMETTLARIEGRLGKDE